MMGHPMPPYDQESEAMLSCRRVVWSLLGAAIEPITEWGDMDEVARQAKLYDNIGCYMWNYGEACPLTREEMEWQLSLYERLVKEGVSEGIIVCSNCIADLGIENVRLTRDWIKAHKNDEV